MNKLFFLALVGFLALQNVESKPKGQGKAAAQNTVQEGEISQIIVKKTEDLIKQIDAITEGHLDSKQIIAKVEESGQNLVNNIKSFNDLIKEKLTDNQGEISSVWKNISDNLKATREDIEKRVLGPDGNKKAAEYREAIKKGLKDTATQIGKIGDAIAPEAEKMKQDVLAGAKLLLDNTEKFASELKTNLAEKPKPKH